MRTKTFAIKRKTQGLRATGASSTIAHACWDDSYMMMEFNKGFNLQLVESD